MSRLSNRDVDALVQGEYEDALAAGEPWALEAYEARRAESADRQQAVGPPHGEEHLPANPTRPGDGSVNDGVENRRTET